MNDMELIGLLFWGWLISILIAICCLAKEGWHNKAKCYLCWSLFPFPLIFHPQRYGFIKSWILFLISPCMISVYCAILLIFMFYAMIQAEQMGTPTSIPYHSSEDLKKNTGVDFPDVVPVDSFYSNDWSMSETTMKFIPIKPLSKEFFRSLDRACKKDSCCWKKDNSGYRYYIYPERPIDRTNGSHIRQVEVNGQLVDDWDGDFITVRIPFKGDTIHVSEGWCR